MLVLPDMIVMHQFMSRGCEPDGVTKAQRGHITAMTMRPRTMASPIRADHGYRSC